MFLTPRGHFKGGELGDHTPDFNTRQQQSWIYRWSVEDLDSVFFQHFYISGSSIEGEKEGGRERKKFSLSPFHSANVLRFSAQHETKSGQREQPWYCRVAFVFRVIKWMSKVQNQPGSKRRQVYNPSWQDLKYYVLLNK